MREVPAGDNFVGGTIFGSISQNNIAHFEICFGCHQLQELICCRHVLEVESFGFLLKDSIFISQEKPHTTNIILYLGSSLSYYNQLITYYPLPINIHDLPIQTEPGLSHQISIHAIHLPFTVTIKFIQSLFVKVIINGTLKIQPLLFVKRP